MKTYKEFIIESYELTEGPNIFQQGLSKLGNLKNYAGGFVGNGPVGRLAKRIPGAAFSYALDDPVSAGLSLARASTRLAPLANRLNPIATGIGIGNFLSDVIDASRGRSQDIVSDAEEKAMIARDNARISRENAARQRSGGTRPPAATPTAGGTRPPAATPTAGGTRPPAATPTAGGTRPPAAPSAPQVPNRPPATRLSGTTPTAPRATAAALNRSTTASTRPIVPTAPTKPIEPTAPPVPKPTMAKLGQGSQDSIFGREGGRQEYEKRMRQAIRTGTQYKPASTGAPVSSSTSNVA